MKTNASFIVKVNNGFTFANNVNATVSYGFDNNSIEVEAIPSLTPFWKDVFSLTLC